MYALIVGSDRSGKSELIGRVLAQLRRPLFGFETKKEDALADAKGSPIYIYEFGKPHIQTEENLVGYCQNRRSSSIPESFDRFAPKLHPPEDCVVVMDEIGFLESKSTLFCDAIVRLLEENHTGIAAVRDKDTPFLNAVRSHPNARCFRLTSENAETLFQEVLEFLMEKSL